MKSELLNPFMPIQEKLVEIQKQGRTDLSRCQLPLKSMEAWQFTDIKRLKNLMGQGILNVNADLLNKPSKKIEKTTNGSCRIILNGCRDPLGAGELPNGISQLTEKELKDHLGNSLKATGCQHHWPITLNNANANYCLALRVEGMVKIPLELVFAPMSVGIQAVRVLLLLEERAKLSLLQVNMGKGLQLLSSTLEAHLGRESQLDHGILAFGDGEAGLLAHTAIVQKPKSNYKETYVIKGWGLARFEPRITQISGEAETTLRGLQVVDADNQIDTHSYVSFEGPGGKLDQVHKAIAEAKGHSIFNGIIRVPSLAQGTKASQLSRNLLISNNARIDTKPELEIVADDVKCTHGATVTQMQQEELFYLQSRGLAADQAAALVKRGYYQDILNDLPNQANIWSPMSKLIESNLSLINQEEK
uniref:ABC transporter, membrane component n=1 Tax=Paulinella chromatophora TaxID=39717 RepID=B1X555_PAUCH|nr:ABC transporter, membrane component [Paulinella chromatophora]ACB43074.1 ABC transporter, membrane component [Paulinella chromatophora]